MSSEFLKPEVFYTLAGETTVVFLLCNTIQAVFNFKPKWFVLLISIIVAIVGVVFTGNPTIIDYVMGFLNGCVICLTALGSNSVINVKPPKVEEVDVSSGSNRHEAKRRSFFQNWIY
ncbi:MAG: hypothetical protein AB9888_17645 [Bacteroidales bacterium]